MISFVWVKCKQTYCRKERLPQSALCSLVLVLIKLWQIVESNLKADLVQEAHVFLAQLRQQLMNKKVQTLTRAAEGSRAQTNNWDLFFKMPQTTSHPRLAILWRLSVSRPKRKLPQFCANLLSLVCRDCRLLDDKLDAGALLPVTAPPIRSRMCPPNSLSNRDYCIYIDS